MINQIVIDPKDPKTLYAAGRPQAMLKSVDRGKSWTPSRIGFNNTSVYHLVFDPVNSKILYAATFGGGVYKSENSGAAWREMNDGLGNTNIHAMAIDPLDASQLVVGTSTGELFHSQDGGGHWTPFSQGLPSIDGEPIVSLLFDPEHPHQLYLGQEGLYTRSPAGDWVPAGEGLKKELITTLAYDPAGKILYAGTKRDGLFTSHDHGHNWTPIGAQFRKQWINKIVIGRPGGRSAALYMSVYASGFFTSPDRGETWSKVEGGFPADDDLMSLAIDPQEPNRLYAGTHNKGIFLSTDGGTTWRAPEVAQEPVLAIINSLVPSDAPPISPPATSPRPPIPPAFTKCTKCHGWADLFLTQKKTFWRVPPNRRDWRPTVKRMGPGAGLTPGEEEEVIRFLTGYSQAISK